MAEQARMREPVARPPAHEREAEGWLQLADIVVTWFGR